MRPTTRPTLRRSARRAVAVIGATGAGYGIGFLSRMAHGAFLLGRRPH